MSKEVHGSAISHIADSLRYLSFDVKTIDIVSLVLDFDLHFKNYIYSTKGIWLWYFTYRWLMKSFFIVRRLLPQYTRYFPLSRFWNFDMGHVFKPKGMWFWYFANLRPSDLYYGFHLLKKHLPWSYPLNQKGRVFLFSYIATTWWPNDL